MAYDDVVAAELDLALVGSPSETPHGIAYIYRKWMNDTRWRLAATLDNPRASSSA